VGHTDGAPCALKQSRGTHGVASVMKLRGGGWNEGPSGGDDWGRAGKRPWEGEDGAWGRPGGKAQRVDDHPDGWGRPTQHQEPSGMLTSTNGHLHHVRQWHGQAAWGVVENSWRDGQTDGDGKIRYGWGMMANAFMQDPRWEAYTTKVRRGDNPSLTWKQYIAALEYKRQQAQTHWRASCSRRQTYRKYEISSSSVFFYFHVHVCAALAPRDVFRVYKCLNVKQTERSSIKRLTNTRNFSV
jgi:hypothetical protein